MNNHEKAVKYFEEIGLLPLDRYRDEYVLHHKDPSWQYEDPERYNAWNPEDLVVMTNAEHSRWHRINTPIDYLSIGRKVSEALTGKKLSEETKAKIRNALKGIPKPEFTEQHRTNLSKAHSGRHWYNNGKEEAMLYECPEGFTKGRLIKLGDIKDGN